MPTQNIFRAVRYRNPERALEWLKEVFGFEEKAVYRDDEGVIQHAELRLGDGLVMFGQTDDTAAEPCNRHSIYVASGSVGRLARFASPPGERSHEQIRAGRGRRQGRGAV